MDTDGHGTDAGRPARPVQGFMALPGRTERREDVYETCLENVVRSLGLGVALETDRADLRTWGHVVRAAIRGACRRGIVLSEESFEVLLRAAVHEPDPSFNRWFVEPALNAFGHRRVRIALLGYLRTGTDLERAGAARAWYWSALPLRMPVVRAENGRATGQAETDDGSTVVAEWNEAALREFVSNENVDVRRCVLPGLSLRKSAYPPELHALVDVAVATARSHPDEYIRHRVEHQVGD
ncbi:hypothetical protein [Streptomyces sp. MBT65]|uniref:hypothetical protein n=1 Tax=Streptomyces sp. MBT65 TaxID=1488395 RepID=UPI001F2CA64D|nr:hypothetical protein [Streptomyces sp. MBT65]